MSLESRIASVVTDIGHDVKSISTAVSGKNPALTVKEEGVDLVSSPVAINFTGPGVSASNNSGTVLVTVPGASPTSYTHTQAVPASVWTITHNLGGYPSVTIIDSGGDEVEGELKYLSVNSLQITFCAAFGGTAYLN